MTAVGSGQHGSEAVGSGFKSLSCQIFLRFRIVTPPLIHKIFRYQKFSETQKGSPTKIFRTVAQQIFDGKLWHSLPPHFLSIKFFSTRNFLKNRRFPYEIFWYCETKNFRRKIVIPPIMRKIFRYPKFSETLKGSPRNFSALWDKQNFDNFVITLLSKTFSRPEHFCNTRVRPTKIFGTVRQNTAVLFKISFKVESLIWASFSRKF